MFSRSPLTTTGTQNKNGVNGELEIKKNKKKVEEACII